MLCVTSRQRAGRLAIGCESKSSTMITVSITGSQDYCKCSTKGAPLKKITKPESLMFSKSQTNRMKDGRTDRQTDSKKFSKQRT